MHPMPSTDDSIPLGPAPTDPLGTLESLGLLGRGRVAEVRARIAAGAYPAGADELIDRLAAEKVLTPYQARMVRSGRAGRLVVGPYLVLRPLARGSMGRVDKAFHPMLGRVVALKRISPRGTSRRARSR